MTEATDMDDMAALADTEVDKWLGAHTDAALTGVMDPNLPLESNSIPLKVIMGLIGELINKVYDLENA